MKPPNVYDETIPSNQRIINRTKIVQSIEHLPDIPHRFSAEPVREWHGSIALSCLLFNSRRITKHEADQTLKGRLVTLITRTGER